MSAADAKSLIGIDKTLMTTLSLEERDKLLDHAVGAVRELELRGIDPGKTGVSLVELSGAPSVVVGNMTTADKVTTLVSGTGSSSPTGLRDSAAFAGRIASPSHAVVAWHGYSAPPDLLHAAQNARAVGGGRALRQFQDSLRSHNPDARLSVVGHSYGATVVGSAASKPDAALDADEIHVMGSPGMQASSADDLAIRAHDGHAEVRVHQEPGDPINFVADLPFIHGADPADLDFGADSTNGRPISTAPSLLGQLTGIVSDAWLIGHRGGDAHSDYRGDERVLEELRQH